MALSHTMRVLFCFRYTLFIVLYPMGVTGELLTIYAALPFVRQAGLYSISLPNKYNFSFDYYTFLILVMISYIPRKYSYVLKVSSVATIVMSLLVFAVYLIYISLMGTLWSLLTTDYQEEFSLVMIE